MKKVSIIIRTKNEERWITHCLEAVFGQTYPDFEVILVDNNSEDNTVLIAKRFPVSKVVNIDKFRPGEAINFGIKNSTGQLIVCLSAHCIPASNDWLNSLVSNIVEPDVAGAYGRQLPLSFTSDIDKRDLLLVFGRDRRVQQKDYFFHNANSIFHRKIWDQFPFDEDVSNIEDRVWGKTVTEAGYKIVYDPEAAVYHYHGLHQGNDKNRARGVVSVIESVDADIAGVLPATLQPGVVEVAALIPISADYYSAKDAQKLLENTIMHLQKSEYVSSVYIIADEVFGNWEGVSWIDRTILENHVDASLDEVLRYGLASIEAKEIFPDSILYVNFDYLKRPPDHFDRLIEHFYLNGYDTVFGGLQDYSHYWFRDINEVFVQTDGDFVSRDRREPIYRALYGQGCLTASYQIRKGKMIGGQVGILPMIEEEFGIRSPKS